MEQCRNRSVVFVFEILIFKALSANDFVYDSSMICNYEQMNGWPWPFSITYGIPQLSSYRTAVTSINNSIWEFPLYAPLNVCCFFHLKLRTLRKPLIAQRNVWIIFHWTIGLQTRFWKCIKRASWNTTIPTRRLMVCTGTQMVYNYCF